MKNNFERMHNIIYRSLSNLCIAFSFFLLLFSTCYSYGQATSWTVELQSDVGRWLPIRASFEEIQGEKYLNISNAKTLIHLAPSRIVKDTLFYNFVDYNSEIAIYFESSNSLNGYWVHYDKPPLKRRLIRGVTQIDSIENKVSEIKNIAGEWKVTFQLPDRSYNGILYLQQEGSKIQGTIRTNSGDYQYLEGKVEEDKFSISTFNGNSIFYLSGEIERDILRGRIVNQINDKVTILAERDSTFRLNNPKMGTKKINDQPFNLDLKDETGKQYHFKELTNNQVTIVTAFGTWCPNCVDEVNYFNQLQKKFPELKIVVVAFESTKDELEQRERVAGFKKRKGIDMLFLIGGHAHKDNTLDKFPMVDRLTAFPTSFLLDKSGEITEIHTGFDGPATGIFYEQYQEELEAKIKNLLQE